MRLLFPLSLIILLIGIARVAKAEPLDVELRYDAAEVAPDFVCLAHYRTRTDFAPVAAGAPACVFSKFLEKTPPFFPSTNSCSTMCDEADNPERPANQPPKTCEESPMPRGLCEAASVFKQKLPSLDSCDAPECMTKRPILFPHGRTTPYIDCVRGNPDPSKLKPAGQRRIVVVHLDFAGLSPELKYIEFKDHVLSAYYATGFDPRRVVTATVVAGSYGESIASTANGGVLRLDLVPLERQVEIVLPTIAVTDANFSLQKDKKVVQVFTRAERTVPFPFANAHNLVVQVTPGAPAPTGEQAPSSPAAEIAELVLSRRESDRLFFEPTMFTFDWHKPCFHPPIGKNEPGKCPIVHSAVASCKSQTVEHIPNGEGQDTVCHYRCESTLAGKPVSLPVRLRMEARSVPATWEEEIAGLGARVSGWVPPRERFVMLDFSDWASPSLGERDDARLKDIIEKKGDAISAVEITRPDGTTARVVPQRVRQRIAIPGIECGEATAYRILGDRTYAIGSTRLADAAREKLTNGVVEGELRMPPPSETGRNVGFELAIGAGLVKGWGGVEFDSTDITPSALRPFGLIEGTLSIQPNASAVHWEFGLRLMVERRPYFPIAWKPAGLGVVGHLPSSVWYDRLLFAPGVAFPWPFPKIVTPDGPVYFATHLNVGRSFPVIDTHDALVGDIAWEYGIDAAFRVPVARRVALEIGGRLLTGSPFYYFDAGDLRGQAVRREATPIWGAFDLSVRAGL
jgi:hypothetical protein